MEGRNEFQGAIKREGPILLHQLKVLRQFRLQSVKEKFGGLFINEIFMVSVDTLLLKERYYLPNNPKEYAITLLLIESVSVVTAVVVTGKSSIFGDACGISVKLFSSARFLLQKLLG